MKILNELFEKIQIAFHQLNQREKTMVAGGGAIGIVLMILLISMLIGGVIERGEHRLSIKTQQLQQVIQLEDAYREKQALHQSKMQELQRSNVRLVSLIEDVAKQTGVEIAQMRPEEGSPNADGVSESRLDVRASGLSIDRIQEFLNKIEKSSGLVMIKRIKINRPYSKDVADLELSISTYKAGNKG